MALDKRKLRREIERDRKARVKARLAELRQLIKQARAARKEALSLIADQCRAERKALTISCATRREQARAEAREAIAARRGDISGVQSEERVYREVDALERGRARKAKPLAKARRQESDDEVRNNLPAELVPVFDVVRRTIKGTPRKSRTEAFLQWAEENPGEVYAMQAAQAERDVAALIAEYNRLSKPPRRGRRSSLASLEDVPF